MMCQIVTSKDLINVLVVCEESQAVCSAFLERGFNAYSCDLKPSSGKYPHRHYQGDAIELLERTRSVWDLVIAHPPCTYLAVSGNRWLVDNPERMKLREEALMFFRYFLDLDVRHIVIENPVSQASQLRPSDQVIHPWQFGDPFEKTTCLWLKNLPPLRPTNIVSKGEFIEFSSGCRMPKWYADLWSLPKEERQTLRAKTFPGIANAMADQWGDYLLKVRSGQIVEYWQPTLF